MYRYFFNNDNDEPPAGPPCTVSRRVEAEYKHATLERYGHVRLAIEPWEGEHDLVIEWCIASSSWPTMRPDEATIPYEYHQAVCQGICQVAFRSEERAPLSNVKVSIIGGTDHPVNGHPSTYRAASGLALIAALKETDLIPLEPPHS